MTENQQTVMPRLRRPNHWVLGILAWLWVALPFSYGVWQLLAKVSQLFGN